jgi:hypothetical protein
LIVKLDFSMGQRGADELEDAFDRTKQAAVAAHNGHGLDQVSDDDEAKDLSRKARIEAVRSKFKKLESKTNNNVHQLDTKIKWMISPDGKMVKKVKKRKTAPSDHRLQPGEEPVPRQHTEEETRPAVQHPNARVLSATKVRPVNQPAADSNVQRPQFEEAPGRKLVSKRPGPLTSRESSTTKYVPSQRQRTTIGNVFKQADENAKREKLESDNIFSDASSDYDPFAEISDGDDEETPNRATSSDTPQVAYFNAIGTSTSTGSKHASRQHLDSVLINAFHHVRSNDEKGSAFGDADEDYGIANDDDDDDDVDNGRPRKKRK